MVFVRKTEQWEFAVWGGPKVGWSIGGVLLNPVCWCPAPAQVKV